MNTRAQADARNLTSGKDGQVFLTGSNGISIFMGEVDAFKATLDITTATHHPLGSAQEMAYPTGYKITVTFTEVVVRDDVTLEPIYKDIENGVFPRWDIRGQVERRDGQYQKQTFGDCVPQGAIDLLSLTPGEIVKRPWSFISNATPKLMSAFK